MSGKTPQQQQQDLEDLRTELTELQAQVTPARAALTAKKQAQARAIMDKHDAARQAELAAAPKRKKKQSTLDFMREIKPATTAQLEAMDLGNRRRSQVDIDTARALAKARNVAEQLGIADQPRALMPPTPRAQDTEALKTKKKLVRTSRRSLDEMSLLGQQRRLMSSSPSSSAAPEALEASLQEDADARAIRAYTPIISESTGSLAFETNLLETAPATPARRSKTEALKEKRKRADSTATTPPRRARPAEGQPPSPAMKQYDPRKSAQRPSKEGLWMRNNVYWQGWMKREKFLDL